ncbi:class I SAM-dependent methyltransferase [Oceanibacterium hippocampi]|uniref:Demethylrebeccamycin-D-glucose O-methyltransferase n=1 Tax=Oceanibacterium hippocampi TaxID=745714 RepID=A0A1Y5SJD6_9PROT|nr:methyltransferase domain-containing protein [Oceanibacterium hippocampi]SLN39018.1 Demethylrebeccamycin-D-glucose O-methyltransferase [Oceanibacterium hippocampi]
MSGQDATVTAHYTRGDLKTRLLDLLREAGKDPDRLTTADLAPVDEFHIRGREATEELIQATGFVADDHILDVGSGIGGPARHLAEAVGCRVTGVDLTPAFCEAATMLAARVGLADRVTYRAANALDMPFADGAFDGAWTQHVAMNIADKAALYREIRRVLKAGAVFALYDVMLGPAGDPHYPVPWAAEPGISFLETPDRVRSLVTEAGFEIVDSWDRSPEGLAWFEAAAAQAGKAGPPPLSLAALLGAEFRDMARNMRRNLAEQRIALVALTARAA